MLIADFPKPKTRPAARRHTCNANYFDRLTHESAYWLGFIMADGSVSVRFRHGNPQFVFALYSNDFAHLEWFKSCIGATHPVHRIHHKVHAIQILSYDLCLSLEQYGVVPSKSKVLQLPKLRSTLRPHMWRGLIDGDGSFNTYVRPSRAVKYNRRGRPAGTGYDVFQLSIVGSQNVCGGFQATFGGSVSKKAGVYQATVTGIKAKRAVKWMYEKPGPALARKRQLAASLGIVRED